MNNNRRRGRTFLPAFSGRRAAGLVVCAAMLAATAGCLPESKSAAKKPTGPKAVAVSVVAVERKAMPLELTTFGTVKAKATVDVRAEVTGMLTKVQVRKGQDVRKDDLLFQIDPRPYQAAKAQAEANIARDRIQEANARREVQREEELMKKGISPRSDYDKALTTADALVATIQADQAAIDRCKLDLDRCDIRSPIDARAGDLLVHGGNLVKANDASLINLNQIQPVEVFFAVPQRDLPQIQKYFNRPKRPRVQVRLAMDAPLVEEGEMIFLDNQVDKSTGTIRLGATFANEDLRLWPGLYVYVSLVLTVQEDALVVPTRAVQTGRDGKFAFVVKPDRKVEVRPVEVRRTQGDDLVVDKGLSAGELVVVEGQVRLSPGTEVLIRGQDDAATRPATRPAGGRAASKPTAGAAR